MVQWLHSLDLIVARMFSASQAYSHPVTGNTETLLLAKSWILILVGNSLIINSIFIYPQSLTKIVRHIFLRQIKFWGIRGAWGAIRGVVSIGGIVSIRGATIFCLISKLRQQINMHYVWTMHIRYAVLLNLPINTNQFVHELYFSSLNLHFRIQMTIRGCAFII